MFIKSLTHFVFLPLVSPFKWSSRNQKLFLLLTDTLYLANSNCPISPHQPLAMLWPLHFVFLQVGQFQILHISGSCSFGPSRQPYLTGEHFHSNLIKKESVDPWRQECVQRAYLGWKKWQQIMLCWLLIECACKWAEHIVMEICIYLYIFSAYT